MDRNRIIYLHQRYTSGAASAEELLEFKASLLEDEAEEVIKSVSDKTWEGISDRELLDVAEVRAREILMEIVSSPQERAVSRLWYRVAVAAAVALVIFGAGLFYFAKYDQVKDPVSVTAGNIVPGGNKAVLTLGNGKKISLTDAANGQVAVQSGIRISKTADGQLVYEVSESAGDNAAVEYNTVEAPVGGQWQLVLPDKSRVWLNAMSSITYPARFRGNERRVRISGEAYFEVAHDRSRPFRVQSLGQTVEVLGTHFNVMAYGDEQLVKTTLLEGSVRVSRQGSFAVLSPGEQAQAGGGGIEVKKNVDLEDVVAWKNGYFKFNENLESIMSKVARWYDVEVVYEYKPDQALTFSGELPRNKDISALLKIIAFNGDVHFKIEGRRVTVMR